METTKLIAWVEIPTSDFYRAVNFYNRVFELNLQPMDWGQEKMACLPNDEGAIVYSPGFEPSAQGVVVSFQTGKRLDNTLQKVIEAGGTVVKPKTKIEAEGRGYFALFTDTEGNRMGLYGE
jgi:uncharacterized protein